MGGVLKQWCLDDVTEIFLHIPYIRESTSERYPLLVEWKDLGLFPAVHASDSAVCKKLVVCRGDDFGPATKWIGAAQQRALSARDILVIVDDDQVYHARTFSVLRDALLFVEEETFFSRHPDATGMTEQQAVETRALVGGCGQRGSFWGIKAFDASPHAHASAISMKDAAGHASYTAIPVDVAEVLGGVALRVGTLRDTEFVDKMNQVHRGPSGSKPNFSDPLTLSAWRADDVIVNLVFSDLGAPRYVLHPRIPLQSLFLPDPLSADNAVGGRFDNRKKYLGRSVLFKAHENMRNGNGLLNPCRLLIKMNDYVRAKCTFHPLAAARTASSLSF